MLYRMLLKKYRGPPHPPLLCGTFCPKKVFPVLANNQLVRGGPLSNASSLEHSTISYSTSLIMEDKTSPQKLWYKDALWFEIILIRIDIVNFDSFYLLKNEKILNH